MSLIDALLSKLGQILPNSSITIPFEMITVYNAVTDIWEAFPLALRMALIGVFGVSVFFCILKMLF